MTPEGVQKKSKPKTTVKTKPVGASLLLPYKMSSGILATDFLVILSSRTNEEYIRLHLSTSKQSIFLQLNSHCEGFGNMWEENDKYNHCTMLCMFEWQCLMYYYVIQVATDKFH
uniref:Uncharacterized protein n=1 Tax=Arion vulgaris TaxID=1028688 RepID=A0A0B7A7X1_9EUPU